MRLPGNRYLHLVGDGPRPRSRRRSARPRRPHAGTLRRRLCPGKPHRLVAHAAGGFSRLPRAAAGALLPHVPRHLAQSGPAQSRQPAHRAADAGALQRNLFRARLSRPLPRLHPRRGGRSHGSRQQGLPQAARRLATGRCDPAPARRRFLRSAGAARRFVPRRARAGAGGARRQRRRRQCLGSGLVQTPALMPYLPALCRHLLGEELRLPSVPAYWCGDTEAPRATCWPICRAWSSSRRFPTMRFNPVFGEKLSREQLQDLADRIRGQSAGLRRPGPSEPVHHAGAHRGGHSAAPSRRAHLPGRHGELLHAHARRPVARSPRRATRWSSRCSKAAAARIPGC